MAELTPLTVDCPACDAQLAIPVSAVIAGRSDTGVVQVDVVPNKTEFELHALVCASGPS